MPEALAWLADLIAALFGLLAFIICLGMLKGYQFSFGYLLGWLANHLKFHIPLPFGAGFTLDIGYPFAYIDRLIVEQLQAGVSFGEWTLHHALAGWEFLQRWNARLIEDLGRAIWHGLVWTWDVNFPNWHKATIGQLTPRIRRAQHKADQASSSADTAAKVAHGIAVRLPHDLAAQRAAIERTTIAHVFDTPQWRGVSHRQARLNARLNRLAHEVAGVGTAAFAATMLANLWGNSRSCNKSDGPIGRIARALCGLGTQALEDLLGLLADVLILENICTVITVLEDGLKFVQPELTAFIGTAEAQFVHCKYDLPANDPMPLPYLPPVTGVVLSLA